MKEIVLFSDSACDLPESICKKHSIHIIPFYVSFNQTDYFKEIKEITISEFYSKMRKERIFPKTSLPSINDYVEAFTPYAKAGKDIICVCLSSHFSGSYNAAVNARELILENYKNVNIAIINSLNATAGQGLLVVEFARMIEKGLDFDSIVETGLALIENSRIFFYVESLDYLEHGGRIGKASALLGTMLNVKPLIYLEKGLLFPGGKIRGKKKAIAKIIEQTLDYVNEHPESFNYMIAHADCIEDATQVCETLKQSIPIDTVEFSLIGTTIGVNTGPDVCGICIIPKFETLLH